MNKFCSIVSLILACLLYGCNSEVDAIRNGRLEAYPEYTVGQAFDNRDMCESTDWATTEDERGRVIIRYTCQMKGITDYYLSQARQLISEGKDKKTQDNLQSTIDTYRQEIPKAKERIKEITEKTKKELTKESVINPLDEKIACLSGYISDIERKIESSSRSIYLEKNPCKEHDDWEPQDIRISRAKSILYYHKEKQLPELIKKRDDAIDYFPTKLRHTISGNTRDLSENIKIMEFDIENYEEKIKKEDESDKQKIHRGEFILENYSDSGAYETVDWILLEDGSFMIIGGALHEKSPGSNDYKTTEHRKIEYILRSAYRNTPSNFFDYKEAIKKQSFIDVFGRYH